VPSRDAFQKNFAFISPFSFPFFASLFCPWSFPHFHLILIYTFTLVNLDKVTFSTFLKFMLFTSKDFPYFDEKSNDRPIFLSVEGQIGFGTETSG
jgi:hypothetical protein